MTWLRLDDNWLTHPKVQSVSVSARMLWIAGAIHCAKHLTDGRIDKRVLRSIAGDAGVSPRLAGPLVDVGLWHDEAEHYVVHDFLEYNPSKAATERQRKKWREAKSSTVESTVDSTSEAANGSTVDSSHAHARPVPTRPREVNNPPTSTTKHPAAVAVVEAVVRVEYEQVARRGGITHPKPYRAQMRAGRWADYGEAITAVIAANPQVTPAELGGLVLNGHEQRLDILDLLSEGKP